MGATANSLGSPLTAACVVIEVKTGKFVPVILAISDAA